MMFHCFFVGFFLDPGMKSFSNVLWRNGTQTSPASPSNWRRIKAVRCVTRSVRLGAGFKSSVFFLLLLSCDLNFFVINLKIHRSCLSPGGITQKEKSEREKERNKERKRSRRPEEMQRESKLKPSIDGNWRRFPPNHYPLTESSFHFPPPFYLIEFHIFFCFFFYQ